MAFDFTYYLPTSVDPSWIEDVKCLNCSCCNALFSFSVRRHHCRSCGRVICGSCSLTRERIRPEGEELRVCVSCESVLRVVRSGGDPRKMVEQVNLALSDYYVKMARISALFQSRRALTKLQDRRSPLASDSSPLSSASSSTDTLSIEVWNPKSHSADKLSLTEIDDALHRLLTESDTVFFLAMPAKRNIKHSPWTRRLLLLTVNFRLLLSGPLDPSLSFESIIQAKTKSIRKGTAAPSSSSFSLKSRRIWFDYFGSLTELRRHSRGALIDGFVSHLRDVAGQMDETLFLKPTSFGIPEPDIAFDTRVNSVSTFERVSGTPISLSTASSAVVHSPRLFHLYNVSRAMALLELAPPVVEVTESAYSAGSSGGTGGGSSSASGSSSSSAAAGSSSSSSSSSTQPGDSTDEQSWKLVFYPVTVACSELDEKNRRLAVAAMKRGRRLSRGDHPWLPAPVRPESRRKAVSPAPKRRVPSAAPVRIVHSDSELADGKGAGTVEIPRPLPTPSRKEWKKFAKSHDSSGKKSLKPTRKRSTAPPMRTAPVDLLRQQSQSERTIPSVPPRMKKVTSVKMMISQFEERKKQSEEIARVDSPPLPSLHTIPKSLPKAPSSVGLMKKGMSSRSEDLFDGLSVFGEPPTVSSPPLREIAMPGNSRGRIKSAPPKPPPRVPKTGKSPERRGALGGGPAKEDSADDSLGGPSMSTPVRKEDQVSEKPKQLTSQSTATYGGKLKSLWSGSWFSSTSDVIGLDGSSTLAGPDTVEASKSTSAIMSGDSGKMKEPMFQESDMIAMIGNLSSDCHVRGSEVFVELIAAKQTIIEQRAAQWVVKLHWAVTQMQRPVSWEDAGHQAMLKEIWQDFGRSRQRGVERSIAAAEVKKKSKAEGKTRVSPAIADTETRFDHSILNEEEFASVALGPHALWKELGFQGKDPCTDFRAMGEYGLSSLVYFSRHYGDYAALLFSKPRSDDNYYPVCASLVNLCNMVGELVNAKKVVDLPFEQQSPLFKLLCTDPECNDADQCSADDDGSSELKRDTLREIFCTLARVFDTVWRGTRSVYWDFGQLYSCFKSRIEYFLNVKQPTSVRALLNLLESDPLLFEYKSGTDLDLIDLSTSNLSIITTDYSSKGHS